MRVWCGVMLAACCGSAAVAAAPERGLGINLGGTLVYDDNIFRLPDSAPSNSRHRSEWIFSPSANITYSRPVGPVEAVVGADLSYDFHRYNKRLDSERIGVNGRTSMRLMRCDTSLSAAYRRNQSDLADVVGTGDIVNVENRINYGVSLLCGDEIGLRPGVSYSHVTVDNESASRSFSDYSADTYTASLGYSRPTFGLLSLYGSYRDGSYPNRPEIAPGLGANDRVRVISGGATYSREIGSRLSGTVSLGYMKVKPKLDVIPEFSGLTYSGQLTFRGGQRISGSLGFSRSAEQSNLLGLSYSIDTVFDGSVNYALNERMSLNAGASYAKRRFEASPLVNSGLGGGGDRTTEVHAGVRYTAVRRITFDLSASRRSRSSKVGLLDYDRNRFTLGVGLKF